MESENDARRRFTRQALVLWHEQAQRPIALADDAGAFSSPFLPFVLPLVVDANVIRDEIVRMARTGTRTIMANAASYGVRRLYCARHVVREIVLHLDGWAHGAGLDPQLVDTVWRDTHMRLLRWVEIPPGALYTPTELERLRTLATTCTGDPDDVPTATLALLLGAPLLSKDRKPVAAVYGEIDYPVHVQWLDALAAGGDLGSLGKVLQATILFGGRLGEATDIGRHIGRLTGENVGETLEQAVQRSSLGRPLCLRQQAGLPENAEFDDGGKRRKDGARSRGCSSTLDRRWAGVPVLAGWTATSCRTTPTPTAVIDTRPPGASPRNV